MDEKKTIIAVILIAVVVFLLTSFVQPAPDIINSTATASIYKFDPPDYYFKRELSREELTYLNTRMEKNRCCWSVSIVRYGPKIMVDSEQYDFNIYENRVILNYYDSTFDHWTQVVREDTDEIYNYLKSRLDDGTRKLVAAKEG